METFVADLSRGVSTQLSRTRLKKRTSMVMAVNFRRRICAPLSNHEHAGKQASNSRMAIDTSQITAQKLHLYKSHGHHTTRTARLATAIHGPDESPSWRADGNTNLWRFWFGSGPSVRFHHCIHQSSVRNPVSGIIACSGLQGWSSRTFVPIRPICDEQLHNLEQPECFPFRECVPLQITGRETVLTAA